MQQNQQPQTRVRCAGIPGLLLACLLVLPVLNGCFLFQRNQTISSTSAESSSQPKKGSDQGESIQLKAAESAASAGDYDTALQLFRNLLAENPTLTTAYIGIGEIHLEQGDFAQAEPAFERASKLEPENFQAQFGYGRVLQMLERYDEAVKAYHRALTIEPDNLEANTNMAITYLDMSEPGRAIAFASKAVQLDRADVRARLNLGAAYEGVGRISDAIKQYETAMELEPEPSPGLMLNLINAYSTERRYQEAVNAANILVKVEPSANAYERLGWGYFRLGDYDRSIIAYREAVLIDPEHWPSLNGIGVNALNTWFKSNKEDLLAKEEARQAFRQSLKVNPEQPKVLELITTYRL